MTTKELLALVDSLQESITDWGDNMRNEAMADLLDHARRIRAALPALCAEVEALRKDAERYRWLRQQRVRFNLSPKMWLDTLDDCMDANLAAKEPK